MASAPKKLRHSLLSLVSSALTCLKKAQGKRKEMLESLLHISSSGPPVKEYEACNQQGSGTMEGEEAQGKTAKVPSSLAEEKGYAKFMGWLSNQKGKRFNLRLRPSRF